uniref:Uncharacterized protein n=1 Tax=Rhizophagus irregularis (strain DAOM 181602 / DAOM 197198 / MUCL 43194) TaxID=747089 RepID=U9TCK5_RHIID
MYNAVRTRSQYVDWIEKKWGVRVDESTITRILQKQFLSDGILVEKAKQLADELNVPEGTLQFSSSWLRKFKDQNNIRQIKLQGEADSADDNAIAEALPLLRNKCAEYPLE